jgi:hypothetical protein
MAFVAAETAIVAASLRRASSPAEGGDAGVGGRLGRAQELLLLLLPAVGMATVLGLAWRAASASSP